MKPHEVRLAAFTFIALLAGAAGLAQGQNLNYPSSRKADVVDEYFGVKVSDPYRWMEDPASPELGVWLDAQAKLAAGYLGQLPLREHFRKSLTALWNYSRTTLPIVEAGRLFYRRNSGLERQSPIYMREGFEAAPQRLVDPNALSPDGAVSLMNFSPAPNGRLLAYTLAAGGADWQTVRVLDVDARKDLADEVKWMRFSWISWTRDSKGFFYSRYPEPPKARVLEAELAGHALYYHRLGTPQSEDVLIYERKDAPSSLVGGWTTEDGRYLMVRVARASGPKNRLYYADLGDPQRPNLRAQVLPLVEEDDSEFRPIGNIGPVIYLRTDSGASNKKIVAVDVRTPQPAAWKTIVPERKEAMRSADLIGNRVVVEYLVDVKSRVELFERDGKALGPIALPGEGAVLGLRGRQDAPEIFYSYTSPLDPATVFSYDPRSGRSTPFEAPRVMADKGAYESRQQFAISRDGTRVPYTITSRKDLHRDGSTPTLLFGYGGFSDSLLPSYRPHAIAWVEAGGAWVSANIRGGGEYGDAWYQAARAEKRQNGFDDFIAVAEDLHRNKYTTPAKLGIIGRSNGGLLVTAVSQQRPDLFAAVVAEVGVLDMLRFDRFTGGRLWTREYGSPSDPKLFAHLLRISPVHNVKPGACYPATLVTTADHDDRVVPSHSFKYTAALQAAQGCGKPVIIRVERNGSHGYRPTDRLIEEIADQWAFAARQLGMAGPK